MIEILEIMVEDLDNPGCNNGNYPECCVTVKDNDDNIRELFGTTCRCQSGCSGTWNLNRINIGDTFDSCEKLIKFLGSN